MPATRIAKTANEAFAEAMRQINPDVVAAYPITPATEIVQLFSQFVAEGKVKTEYVTVESEHSAMSACIGASAAGARTLTGTSSQGLAYMWEMLYIASGLRLPIVMGVVNRALSAPINIHCDHSDTMGARDSGWIQIFSENVQEGYDNFIQAIRIAEHPDVNLPVMVTTDGFILSHCLEGMDLSADSDVTNFIGEPPVRTTLLNSEKPLTLGAIDLQDYYFEHRRQIAEAMKRSLNVIPAIGKEYGAKFGREYGFFEEYRLDDAEIAIVLLGSTVGTAKDVVDQMRASGKKVGLLKLRIYRPFPFDALKSALSHIKVLGVVERSDGLNASFGPLYPEICATLYGASSQPKILNYIYGLGGREVKEQDIEDIFVNLISARDTEVKSLLTYIGVRE